MSKLSQTVDVESADDFDLNDSDYHFIFDSGGNLKSMTIPTEMPVDLPKNIRSILRMHGVTYIDQAMVGCQYIH